MKRSTEGADANLEIELKLALGEVSTRRLLRHPALAVERRGRAAKRLQYDRYYDTPSFALARAGVSLRVRQCGGGWRQTIKAQRQAAVLHERAEFEVALTGPEPDLGQFEATPWAGVAAGLGEAPGVRFEVHSARTEIPLKLGQGSRALLALDRGHVQSGAKREDFAEAEIEVVRGAPAEAIALARELARDLPLALETRSKALRGWSLAGFTPAGPGDAALKAPLPADAGGALPGLAALGNAALTALAIHARHALERDVAEDIHQARVALRRLIALLRLARLAEARAARAALKSRVAMLRGLYRCLGAVRDGDVFMATLGRLEGPATLAAPIERLIQSAARRRLIHQEAARAALGAAAFQALVLDLGQDIAGWRVGRERHDLEWLVRRARAGLAESDRQLRASVAGLARAKPEAQHAVRRLARKTRDEALLIAPSLGSARARSYLKRLGTFQAELGAVHDLEAARLAAVELAAARLPEIDTWLALAQHEALTRACRAAQRFRDERRPWE